MQEWISITVGIIAIVGFFGNIAFSVWGKPPSIQKVLDELKLLKEEAIKQSQEQQEFHRQIKKIWEKIDCLMDMSIAHAQKISYIEGKINGRKNKNTQEFHQID
jgi:phosphosulfolactate synthase (CoM biosynthesis protein A)